jgi:hypothetical protein
MLSECDFKKELINIENSYYKFRKRDLEITRSCYHCRCNIDQNNCVLFQIYGQRLPNIELNKLLEEINNRKNEIIHIQDYINELKIQKENKEKEIINLDKDIEIYNNKVVKVRANDFLRTIIGGENYLFYKNNGYFDIIGTNNSIYRITNKGMISKIKIKKGLVDRIKGLMVALLTIFLTGHQKRNIETLGQIIANNYPLEDVIAVVYANIMKDSDKFDKDKGCGRIIINSI